MTNANVTEANKVSVRYVLLLSAIAICIAGLILGFLLVVGSEKKWGEGQWAATMGTALQLIGAIVTAAGLFYAWRRASARSHEWRKGIEQLRTTLISKLGEWAQWAKAKFRTPSQRYPRVVGVTASGPLDGLDQETLVAIVDSAIAQSNANAKAVEVKDIRVALVGLGVSALGSIVTLFGQVFCS